MRRACFTTPIPSCDYQMEAVGRLHDSRLLRRSRLRLANGNRSLGSCTARFVSNILAFVRLLSFLNISILRTSSLYIFEILDPFYINTNANTTQQTRSVKIKSCLPSQV